MLAFGVAVYVIGVIFVLVTGSFCVAGGPKPATGFLILAARSSVWPLVLVCRAVSENLGGGA